MKNLCEADIGFIGAGRAGVTLGAYLCSKGINVKGYASRSMQSALTAAAITSTRAYKRISELVNECDIIFVTTPDDQIASVWNDIAANNIKGRIICHTSGSRASDIFVGISESQAFGYSIHPMYAFSDRSGRFDGLETACFTIEGNVSRLGELKSLFNSIGNRVLVMDAKSKPLYHIANVAVSNLVLSLINIGCDLLQKCGVHENDALAALMPLILNNINNIKGRGFANSLTGPIDRNDSGTVLRHMKVLPDEYRNIYCELSLKLLKLSKEKHPQADYSDMENILKREGIHHDE